MKTITRREVHVKRFTVGLTVVCTLLVLAGNSQSQNAPETFTSTVVLSPIIDQPFPKSRDELPPQTELCYQLDGFCDRIFLQVNPGTGFIEGINSNCNIGGSLLVGGQYVGFPDSPDNDGPWVIFFDYKPDVSGHDFEYGIITGQGTKGFLQRYWPDGTPYNGDLTAVTLMSCDNQSRGTPTSRAD